MRKLTVPTLLLVVVLSACGQSGALIHPDSPEAQQERERQQKKKAQQAEPAPQVAAPEPAPQPTEAPQ